MTAVTALLGAAAFLVAPSASGTGRTAVRSASTFAKSETLTRSNLVNGVSKVVDTRHFSLKVGSTAQLRDRQEVNVSWTGAHPTGGIVGDPNSFAASTQEYPVVLMMCRGTASTLSQKTCWTQTPGERVQVAGNTAFPPYRLDRYATAANRALSVGVPSPFPSDCPKAPSAQHWVPFLGANGHLFPGGSSNASGNLICNAGIPPEQAAGSANLQPGNTTYAVSNTHGSGSTKFVITTSDSNASLGCSDRVKCSLVVIPIIGTSCDPAGDSLPPADRPGSDAAAALALCSQTGFYPAGSSDTNSTSPNNELAVSGSLWWTASNWRNRVVVPLSFAEPANECSVVNNSAPVDIYGSYLLLQATQQWSPYFCLNPKLFALQHVQASEPEAKNLLATGSVSAAFQGLPPPTPFTTHVVQAPTAVTGFAIVDDIDTAKGVQALHIRLDARLLAKLLTESYTSNATLAQEDTALRNPKTGAINPLDLAQDPEFKALNPGIATELANSEPASTLLFDSADSDEMTALTTYINDNAEARAWLDGKPDPWGMVVNPKYKGISLPVSSFPLLDTFEPPGLYASDKNPCLANDPTAWLPLVASPVEQPATITLDMQFAIANSQIVCSGTTSVDEKLTAVGRETAGGQFLLGITSLADAKRYDLNSAELETQGGSTSSAQFTSAAGRSFVGPTDASLEAAAAAMTPNKTLGSWTLPYTSLQKGKAGAGAYPGTMLVSTDVPTSGLTTSEATDYSKFLSFVAAAGQRTGLGNGQLPPGYLPMTKANGLNKFVAYTVAAADAVATQKGVVPSLTDPGASATTSSSPTPGSTSTSGTSSTGPSGPGVITPASTAPSASATSPSVAPSPTSTASGSGLSTEAGQPVALVKSVASGVVFPLVLLLGVICGGAAATLWVLDRRKRGVA